MTADELHELAVRTRDAARLAERHGTSVFGYRRAAREACERMGEMAEQVAKAERERDEAHLTIDQALGGGMDDLETQLADAEDALGRGWLAGGVSLAEGIRRKTARLAARESARCEASLRARWEQRTSEARRELRALVAALSLDDGPRAAAIQHARAVLAEWGMR